MKITLWGEHATNFNIDSIYDDQAGNLIVCLVVGCIPREDFKDSGNSYFQSQNTFQQRGCDTAKLECANKRGPQQ